MIRLLQKYFLLLNKSVFILSVVTIFIFGLLFFLDQKKTNEDIISFGESITRSSARQIDSVLYSISQSADQFADTLSKRTPSKDELEQKLKELTLSQKYIMGATVAYMPYEFDKDIRLYAPFYTRKENRVIQTGELYDYTDRSKHTQSHWFFNPIEKHIYWAEPGYGPAAQAVVTEYGIPFYDPENREKAIGTVDITFSLQGFTKLLNSLKLGKTGFAMLVSNEGAVLSHPREDYLLSLKSLKEISGETDDEEYQTAITKLLHKETGYLEYLNPLLNRKSIVFYQSIPSTKWSLAITVVKDELEPHYEYTYRKEIVLSILVLIAIITGSVVFFRLDREGRSWIIAVEISLLFLFEIGFIWELHQQKPMFDSASSETVISDVNSLNTFINRTNTETEHLHEDPPAYIPTGIFIRNIEFKEGRLIGLNGTIWQKLDTAQHKGIEPGVVFPDLSTDAEAFTMEEAYNKIENGHQIIGWNFRLNILNNVEYQLYPFDRKDLKINMRHKTVGKNIFLVPDQDAYESLIPSTTPGVNKGIPLVGWEFLGSFFSYEYKNMNTNFGLSHFQRQRNLPELGFNVVLSRKIVGALIAHILPLLIIQLMLFGVTVIFSKHNIEISGYNTFGVINSCAAFFFVIVISHIDLRNKLEVEMITYLEYIYFIVYLYVLLVTVNSLLFSADRHYAFVDYKNNYFPKLFFWPAFMFATILITIVLFY